jgi:hypothetical protein
MSDPKPEVRTTETTIKDLQTRPDTSINVRAGFESLHAFELMQRQAKLLMVSSLVPKAFQNNLPNCVIALNMANRIGADPLMVMQNLYVVHGSPSWSAQFVIACFNQCGRFSSMRFEWRNTPTKVGDIPDEWGCRAYATELKTGEKIFGPWITIKMSKAEGWYQKSGSKWQTIPELMLMYRAGSWMQRTSAPDISMGLRTAEEVHDVFDARRGGDGVYRTDLDSLRPGEGMQEARTDEPPGGDMPEIPDGAGVDRTTGEVTGKYTEAGAIKHLESKRTSKTLTEAYDDICDDYRLSGREVTDAIGIKYQEMLESLKEREKV